MLNHRPVYENGRFVPTFVPGRPPMPPNFVALRVAALMPSIARNPLTGFAEINFQEPVSVYSLFGKPFALINDPALIRHIFVERADALVKEQLSQKILRYALRDGMLTAEGDVWRKSRRAIAPMFSPRHVAGFGEAMVNTTERFVDELRAGPQQVDLAPAMSKLAFLILSETLFSGEINSEGEQILADTALFLEKLGQPDPLDLMNAPDWLPRVTRMRGHSSSGRLRSIVRAAAEARREAIEAGRDVPDDFLTLLLRAGEDERTRLTLDEIEDNVLTFVAAGHETTARAVTWTLYCLAHDPEALARAQGECDALDTDLPAREWSRALPWTMACFEEAMRLFPPAAVIIRELQEDVHFNGYHIEKGRNAYISQWVLHRHQNLWDEPNAFVPARMFGEARGEIDRFAYLPFGLGPRVCIGASFAMQEAAVMLALLVRAFSFTYAGMEMPKPVMRITVQPDNGMPMRLRPRETDRAATPPGVGARERPALSTVAGA